MKLYQTILPAMEEAAWNRLESTLTRDLRGVQQADVRYVIKSDRETGKLDLSCEPLSERLPKTAVRRACAAVLARVLADCVVEELEQRLLARLASNGSPFTQAEETAKLVRYSAELLNGEGDGGFTGTNRRSARIAAQLADYLQEHSTLHLEGFVTFRLPAYRKELEETLDYAVEEMVMDQQYQDFISLLKYYVFIQDTIIPAAHLMHKGGHEFQLLNEQMKPIDPKLLVDRHGELPDQDGTAEDMIVSALLTVSPRKIFIHTREPDLQVIKTIQQIFENRVELCT